MREPVPSCFLRLIDDLQYADERHRPRCNCQGSMKAVAEKLERRSLGRTKQPLSTARLDTSMSTGPGVDIGMIFAALGRADEVMLAQHAAGALVKVLPRKPLSGQSSG